MGDSNEQNKKSFLFIIKRGIGPKYFHVLDNRLY
jgi:hypothetical protein